MRVIHCEQCGTPLPWSAQFCAICGAAVSLHPLISDYPDAPGHSTKLPHADSLQTYSFCKMGSDHPDETQRLDQAQVRESSALLPVEPTLDVAAASPEWSEDCLEEEEMHGVTLRRDTWQKVVTRKPLAVAVRSVSAAASSAPVVPREPVLPATPPYRIRAELAPTLALLAPPPPDKRQPPRSSLIPRVAGLVAIALIVALLLSGGFGVFVSLAHSPIGSSSLQVTPSSIALGGIVTLRGSHFTPRGRIRLTRDASIPITDTDGLPFITADANGSFSDTASIDDSWTAGTHSIHAEDAHLHKTASFPVLVTGQGTSLSPAHLALSVASIDLGPGDQATNSAQTITLSNAGGDKIDWQTTVTQPWLLLSPQNGSLAAGQQMQVTLAADRSVLQIGSYSASVIFTSNSGFIPLPVKIQVTPLQPGHTLIMQVTPAALSFSGNGGSASLAPQAVIISTPGVLPLQWNASSATNDGSNWLSVFPLSGTVAKGDAQSVTVSVDSSQLLPGVYYGSVTFSIQGSPVAANNLQTIYVSVTIGSQCAIQVAPGALSFSGVYLQPAPPAKSISVGVNRGCSAPLNWTASASTVTGGRWLTISASAGATPSSPRVGVNVTGLKPGSYSGALVFSSSGSTQTLPVTLVIGQATTPTLLATPASLTVNGVVGQKPSIQSIVLSNTGGGTLSWSAVATTTAGGAWLSVTPAQGVLASRARTTLTVTVTVLNTLVPGTYTGSITITSTDSTGHAAGSVQTLPVTFIVQGHGKRNG